MSEIKTNKISSLTSSNSDITLDPDGTGNLIVESGNVGIGTASPSNLLTLQSSGSTKLNIRHTASGNDYGYIFRTTGATTNDLIVESEVNGASTERMRIGSSGNISTTANYADYAFQILNDGNDANRRGIRIQCGSDSGAGTNYLLGFVDGDGNSVGSITFSGSNTSFNTSSDHRLKENVADMTGAIDRVKALAPKRFNFIRHPDTTVDGFIAHEAQAVVPEAVTGTHNEVDDDGNPVMQGIDQSKLVPLLTGALREAIAKIEALEARVTALENA